MTNDGPAYTKNQRVVLGKSYKYGGHRAGKQGTVIYISESRRDPYKYTVWFEGDRDPIEDVSEKHLAALPDHVQDSSR